MPDETDAKSNIVQLVQRKTPKQIAKAFYDGSLTAEDRINLGPGMRHLIALAETDNQRATTAKRQALKDLSELAELARDQDGAGVVHCVDIVPIRSIEDGTAELA
jgi:hypothetical protein